MIKLWASFLLWRCEPSFEVACWVELELKYSVYWLRCNLHVRAHLACHFNCPIETEALVKVTGSLVHVKSGNISETARDQRRCYHISLIGRQFRRPGVTFKFKVIHQETFTNGIFRALVHGVSDKISADCWYNYVSHGHFAIARAELLLQSNPISNVSWRAQVVLFALPASYIALRSHTNWYTSIKFQLSRR